MSAVEIVPVRGRAELDRFIRPPAEIAIGDPMVVPPLLPERGDALSPGENPHFDHAETQFGLAMRDGRPVGRINQAMWRIIESLGAVAYKIYRVYEKTLT